MVSLHFPFLPKVFDVAVFFIATCLSITCMFLILYSKALKVGISRPT